MDLMGVANSADHRQGGRPSKGSARWSAHPGGQTQGFGSRAVSVRPLALRPRLATGVLLSFSSATKVDHGSNASNREWCVSADSSRRGMGSRGIR
jgi:hypothetical protein